MTDLDLDAVRAYAKAHRWDDAPASTLAVYVEQLADALEVARRTGVAQHMWLGPLLDWAIGLNDVLDLRGYPVPKRMQDLLDVLTAEPHVEYGVLYPSGKVEQYGDVEYVRTGDVLKDIPDAKVVTRYRTEMYTEWAEVTPT